MRLVALLAAALVTMGAEAQPRRAPQTQPPPPPAFSFLSSGGGVSHVHTDLDRLFPSEMQGGWWALHGDSSTAGPVALSPVGSPQSQTDRVCPNGPDCEPVVSQRLNGSTQAFQSAPMASPTGSFTACALARVDAVGSPQMLVTKDDNVTTNGRGFTLLIDVSARARVDVFKSDSTSTPILGGTLVSGAIHFVCATYAFVADASSILTLYVDGAQANQFAAAVGPVQPASSVPWAVGRRGGNFLAGNVFSAFVTEKVLSPTTIAAMASAVLPQVQGSRGETLTTSRPTVRACCTSAGCTMLPPNRPCVQGAALDVSGSVTNLAYPSGDVSAWTAIGTPTESAGAVIARDGTRTAATIGDDSTSAVEGERVAIAATAGSPYTLSCDVMASTSPAARLVLDGTSCAISPGATWARYSCTDTSASGASINADVYPTDAAVSSTGSVSVTGCQVEVGTVAHPPCPTTTSSAACGPDTVTVPTTGWPTGRGAIETSFTPHWSACSDCRLLDTRIGTPSNGLLVQATGNAIILRSYDGVTSASTSAAVTWTPEQRYRIRIEWGDGSARILRDDAVVGVGLAVAPTAHAPSAFIGSTSGTTTAEGTISDLRVGQ